MKHKNKSRYLLGFVAVMLGSGLGLGVSQIQKHYARNQQKAEAVKVSDNELEIKDSVLKERLQAEATDEAEAKLLGTLLDNPDELLGNIAEANPQTAVTETDAVYSEEEMAATSNTAQVIEIENFASRPEARQYINHSSIRPDPSKPETVHDHMRDVADLMRLHQKKTTSTED